MEHRGKDAARSLRNHYGTTDELCRRLRSSPSEGLYDAEDIDKRRRIFGCNVIPPKPPKTFLALVIEAVQDATLMILIGAAIISLILPFVIVDEKKNTSDRRSEWIEGVGIFIAVFVVVLVTAGNNYSKDKQFRGLQSSVKKEQKVSVVRRGENQQILTADLVVGDICMIKYGDMLPADGIILQCNDLKVDESTLTGETDLVKKGVDLDPFLLSATQVMEGSGKMLVTAVGVNSQTGIIMKLMGAIDHNRSKSQSPESSKSEQSSTTNVNAGLTPKLKAKNHEQEVQISPSAENGHCSTDKPIEIELTDARKMSTKEEELSDTRRKERSVLQAKLTRLATQIGYAGTAFAVLTVIALVVQFSIDEYVIAKHKFEYEHIQQWLNAVITGITVLVIAVPEGLPLAVTLALAYSVKKMMKDHNLVRHLYACETMGNATSICSDKTGTLTTNVMTVVQCYLGGFHYKDSLPKWNDLNETLRDILVTSISINSGYSSQVLPAKEHGAQPKQIGNKTECALLGLVMSLGQHYQPKRDEVPEEKFVKVFTFNSARKSMSTAIRKTDTQGGYRLFSKGASEVILRRCSYILGDTGRSEPLSEAQQKLLNRTVIDSMASKGLRTICLAYKDFVPKDALPSQVLIKNDVVDWDDETTVVSNMTCIALLGIQDPVRPEVPASIRKCQKAGITVRMVTGDNLQTARSIATQCGIIRPSADFIVLEGPEFNRKIRDEEGRIQQELLDQIWPKLRVLARSSPSDKFVLVRGIIESKLSKHREVVAVTGDGTNDGPALKKADVGFAMGIAGTDVAKDASDIILTDDNFTSIVKAVMWGRNVYDSISKFLQFQLTVNVVAVLVAFLGACFVKDTPIRAIQMLWVNLIMDSLAALALATEIPTEELLTRKPYGRKKPIITRTMSKNILGHAFYQLIIMFVAVVFGDNFFDIDDGMKTPHEPSQHFTFVFNIFVVMTLFNMFNARKIHDERHVFKAVATNPLFCGIWIICFVVQVLIVEFGGSIFATENLTATMWLWCIFFGVGELLWGQVLATIPSKRLPKKMTVGGGDVVEIPLVGFEEPDRLLHPCDDRSPKGLWKWGVGRINMKMQVVKAFQDTNGIYGFARSSRNNIVRKSLGKISLSGGFKHSATPSHFTEISFQRSHDKIASSLDHRL